MKTYAELEKIYADLLEKKKKADKELSKFSVDNSL